MGHRSSGPGRQCARRSSRPLRGCELIRVFVVRRLFRFSLLTLFVAVTVVACLMWKVRQVERQRQAVAWIQKQRGSVYYDYETREDGSRMRGVDPPGWRWLRELIGVDYFATVRFAFIQDMSPLVSAPDPPVTDLTPLAQLGDLEGLYLRLPHIRNISALRSLTKLKDLQLEAPQVDDLTPLRELVQLRRLYLSTNHATDFTFLTDLTELKSLSLICSEFKNTRLLSSMTELENLWLRSTRIRDISPFRNFTRLRWLNLERTLVTDISALSHLENLTELWLDDTRVNDLSPLKGLAGLRKLGLCHVAIAAEEIRRLQDALPNCQIFQRALDEPL